MRFERKVEDREWLGVDIFICGTCVKHARKKLGWRQMKVPGLMRRGGEVEGWSVGECCAWQGEYLRCREAEGTCRVTCLVVSRIHMCLVSMLKLYN